ncbi:hypothetical protein GCM10023190_07770 [Enteractinococcus fodinae]|nr:FtsK/SpoIIIE domain-containing protein [Enteractinococcus fodinae]
MYLQIFGLASPPAWWYLSRVPAEGGAELAAALRDILGSRLKFYCGNKLLDEYEQHDLAELWTTQPPQILAKPADAEPRVEPETYLKLITTTGPDAGRVFPLTRRNLSVGRASARAQVRDPWLSGYDFDIRLASDGPTIISTGAQPRVWDYGDVFISGQTTFVLRRGIQGPLHAPRDPGDYAISPGQPPSPPNLLLQIIGAAAPLLIGVVLMLVTGMWYFLLFSGISVIIAAVLILQYRRARSRHIAAIHDELQRVADRFAADVFTPHELIGAFSSPDEDPLALTGLQPTFPVVTVGTGARQAQLTDSQDSDRWASHLVGRVSSVLCLEPGSQTLITGDLATRRALKHWLLAQIMRHAKATGTGFIDESIHVGGPPAVEVLEGYVPAPDPKLHQLIFLRDSNVVADDETAVVDLNEGTIEGPYRSTNLEVFGLSEPTLQLVSQELLLTRPAEQVEPHHLNLTQNLLEGTATAQMLTTVGSGKLGLSIDLVREGPHLLITGTTGSGKSELLLTVLVGLAQRYPPSEMSLILLDFKGGSSFNVLAALPHTMSVETNHVAAASFRSLEAIAAELYRREALFAKHLVADYAAYRRAFPQRLLPRLVVAIDELRVLVDQNTEAATTLAHLAATGRSLGFHLILATQRTQGAVSADIRANIGSTIALRTATEHDSWDVLGSADAFQISPVTPGRAYFKAGAAAPRMFQTARYTLEDDPLLIVPQDDPRVHKVASTSDWPGVVRRLQQSAAVLPTPPPVILPALVNEIEVATLREQYGTTALHTPIGLVDDPANCRQYPVEIGTSGTASDELRLSGSVAWIGAAGSGLEALVDVVSNHVVRTAEHKILFEGRQLAQTLPGWDYEMLIDLATSDALRDVLDDLRTKLASGMHITLVITEWGSWANAPVTGSFQGLEECLIRLMRQFSPLLTVYVFGARELAGGRLLATIPDRFYIPKNSTAEHQLIWPTLRLVPPVTARAVLVTADQPQGGLEVQLCIG